MNSEFVKQLHGLSCQHIDFESLEKPVHKQAVKAIKKIKADAAVAGYELCLASGFRDFERQRLIWNSKLDGSRLLRGSDEQIVDVAKLNNVEKVYAVMRWSALPGSSRHHWGSDIDIYDKSSLPDDYHLQLTVAETRSDGIMSEFYQWLDSYLALPENNCWFRPYQQDRGGVAVEPWHLSYTPVAKNFERAMSCETLVKLYQVYPIALGEIVLENLSELYERFIMAA